MNKPYLPIIIFSLAFLIVGTGIVYAGSLSSAKRLTVYGGVLSVDGNSDVLEIGNAGRDITSTGFIFIRPGTSNDNYSDPTDPGTYFEGVGGVVQNLHLTGDLCFNSGLNCYDELSIGGGPWTLSGTNIYNSNTGNVGVGINNPTTKLHVQGDTTLDGLVMKSVIPRGSTSQKSSFIGFQGNRLFNSHIRPNYTVTQTGNCQIPDWALKYLFDGNQLPTATAAPGATVNGQLCEALGIHAGNPLTITIDFPNDMHSQGDVAIGWTTRAWRPTTFFIELEDRNNPGTWYNVASESGWSSQHYYKTVSCADTAANCHYGGMRLTMRAVNGATNTRTQLSEIFMLWREQEPYDSLYANLSGDTFFDTVTINRQGTNGTSFSALSGNTANYNSIAVGRASDEVRLGVAAGGNHYFTNIAAGDAAIRVDDVNKFLLLGAGSANSTLKISSADVQVGSAASPRNICLNDDGSRINCISAWPAGGGSDGDWTINDPDIFSALTGQVGIGQSTPAAKLTVNLSETVGQEGSGGDAIYAYANSSNAAVSANNPSAGGWAGYFSGNVTVMGGNFAIGTETPDYLVQIARGDVGPIVDVAADSELVINSTDDVQLALYSNASLFSTTISQSTSGVFNIVDGQANFRIDPSGSFDLMTGGVSNLTIDNEGEVGIGVGDINVPAGQSLRVGGLTYVVGDVRANRFVDTQSTSYYVDPWDFSRLYELQVTRIQETSISHKSAKPGIYTWTNIGRYYFTGDGTFYGPWEFYPTDSSKNILGIRIRGQSDDGGGCIAGWPDRYWGTATRNMTVTNIEWNGAWNWSWCTNGSGGLGTHTRIFASSSHGRSFGSCAVCPCENSGARLLEPINFDYIRGGGSVYVNGAFTGGPGTEKIDCYVDVLYAEGNVPS